MYVHDKSPIDIEKNVVKTKEKDKKYGYVVRTGDVIKFGRISVIIRESSIDARKSSKPEVEEEVKSPSDDILKTKYK